MSIEDSFARFCSEFLPLCPVIDPRGKKVQIVKGNFPKLVDLEHSTLTKAQHPASLIVKSIESGTFEIKHYRQMRTERIETLFWVPECISDPDAIFPNGHKMIVGDEVYVRVYDKMGSSVKLVFTMDIKKSGRVIRTVPVTSFFTNSKRASLFVKGVPLFVRK